MNWLLPLALGVLVALPACGGGAAEDAPLTAQEKDEQRSRLHSTYVGTWTGGLVPESGERPTFVLKIEARATEATPKCGTFELGAGVGARCIDIYQTNARATLTTSDGRFTEHVADGTMSTIEARFELPNAGYLSLGQGGGSFSYGEGELTGSIQASRK